MQELDMYGLSSKNLSKLNQLCDRLYLLGRALHVDQAHELYDIWRQMDATLEDESESLKTLIKNQQWSQPNERCC